MAFRKIRETIAAFQTPQDSLTMEEKLEEYRTKLDDRIRGNKVREEATNLVVALAVGVPLALLIGKGLGSLFNVNHTAMSTIIGVSFTFFLDHMRNNLFDRLPLYKLNPYFGSKIEETILSFRQKDHDG